MKRSTQLIFSAVLAATLSGAAFAQGTGKCVNGALTVTHVGVGNRTVGALSCKLVVIENAGVGDINVGSVTATELRVTLSGTGTVNMGGGSTESSRYTLAGAGDIKAVKLTSKLTTVAISGMGNAEVNATTTLDTDISGVVDVRYTGQPKLTNKSSGVGSVKPM